MPKLINLQGEGAIEERQIDKKEMMQMVRDYKRERTDVIAQHGNNRNDSRACYFSKAIYEKILVEAQCDGIRTYYGIRTEPSDKKRYHTIILVGTRNRKDALTDNDYVAIASNPADDDGTIYEWGSLCPPGEGCAIDTLLAEADQLDQEEQG
ncbi:MULTISPECIES: hypothetical protein [Rufibacter]|uniref:Uncharacterized protein n=1 Tax=Rufibacter quisquiliarum TaxID=1549639 RepID=A0A839GUG4_9BACT|nr:MULTISPECIES: hypothetical protein [Rufibacter]MBA9078426.1 hypothetical protein [Rufibacter quisquiliarum]